MDHIWIMIWGELIVGTVILTAAIHYFTKPNIMSQFSHLEFSDIQERAIRTWEPFHILLPKADSFGNLYFIMPMACTWAIVCGADKDGYSHRFCYKTLLDCLQAYDEWEPSMNTEPSDYIKRKE